MTCEMLTKLNNRPISPKCRLLTFRSGGDMIYNRVCSHTYTHPHTHARTHAHTFRITTNVCVFLNTVFGVLWEGRLKMREWKMRYGQNTRVENAGVGQPYGKPNRYYTVRQP